MTTGRRRLGRPASRLCATVVAVLAAVSPALTGSASAAPPSAAASIPVLVQLRPGADVSLESREAASRGRLTHVFRDALQGFAGSFTPEQVAALRRDPSVALVEPDAVVSAAAATDVWGLDRVDQRRLPLSGTYTPPATGSGVTAYVVDTGISPHPEFGTRLRTGHSQVPDGRGTTDCDGHGTHVAGSLGGTRHGVAPGVRLVPVRVLDCSGNGRISTIVAGLDWVVAQHRAGAPAVANLSLNGAPSSTLDAAVRRVVSDGVSVAVAAGNGAWDSCSMSPSRVPAALTVGATDRSDRRAVFSNYGPCLDLFAPGADVVSARVGGGTVAMSGTSMAAPHVAGAAAVLLSRQPGLTPAQVAGRLTSAATTGVVTGRGAGSPDRLLFVG